MKTCAEIRKRPDELPLVERFSDPAVPQIYDPDLSAAAFNDELARANDEAGPKEIARTRVQNRASDKDGAFRDAEFTPIELNPIVTWPVGMSVDPPVLELRGTNAPIRKIATPDVPDVLSKSAAAFARYRALNNLIVAKNHGRDPLLGCSNRRAVL